MQKEKSVFSQKQRAKQKTMVDNYFAVRNAENAEAKSGFF